MTFTRWKIRYTKPAQVDLARIRTYTRLNYGIVQEQAYKQLIFAAVGKLKEGVRAPGTVLRDAYLGLYTLHITLGTRGGRHFLLYRADEDERIVEILRILHDASDLERHITGGED